MRRLIIADAHVGQRPGDAAEMAKLVLLASRTGAEEIVYLGDAFQYLIGFSKFWIRPVGEVMAAWDEARARGLRIVLIEGNRDFFLDARDLALRVDHTGRRYDFVQQGVHYRLVHGDRVNLRDLQYQFWSRLSKSLPARAWAYMLPRSLALAIVRGMEAKLATTNQRFRYVAPTRALERRARRAWSEGVDVMLWGHFHTSWRTTDGRRTAMVVPAWLETHCSLAVDDDGRWHWVEKTLTPCAEPPRMNADLR